MADFRSPFACHQRPGRRLHPEVPVWSCGGGGALGCMRDGSVTSWERKSSSIDEDDFLSLDFFRFFLSLICWVTWSHSINSSSNYLHEKNCYFYRQQTGEMSNKGKAGKEERRRGLTCRVATVSSGKMSRVAGARGEAQQQEAEARRARE
jgi:hypothetical protein